MNTATDLLERAKCGTVVVDLPSSAQACDLYSELCTVATESCGDTVVLLDMKEKRVIINPS